MNRLLTPSQILTAWRVIQWASRIRSLHSQIGLHHGVVPLAAGVDEVRRFAVVLGCTRAVAASGGDHRQAFKAQIQIFTRHTGAMPPPMSSVQ